MMKHSTNLLIQRVALSSAVAVILVETSFTADSTVKYITK